MSPKESDVSERELELIEKVAKKISDSDFDFFAITLLQTIKPMSWIGGELSYFFLAPFLPLLEDRGYEFIDTFEKRENLERLIKRVEALHKEKDRGKKKKQGQSIFSRLREAFSINKLYK